MKRIAVGRRTLLKGLGLGVGALTLPSLLPRGVQAGVTGPVRRLALFMTEHGTVYQNWRMRPAGQPEDQDWEFALAGLAEAEFSEILRPLWPVRDKLLILDGLSLATGMMTGINEHEEGHATCLTGALARPVDGGIALAHGPSIDQIVAAQVAEPDQFRSLQISHGSWPYCFDAGGASLPWISDPFELYTSLFPGGPGDPAEPPTDVDHIRAGQTKVVDLVRQQYAALAPKLSGEDRRKIEQHRDLLASLGDQLAGLAGAMCEVPDAPGAAPPWESPEYYFDRAELYTRLASVALSCDLTRVVTLAYSGLRNEHVDAPAGDLHNDFAHQASTDPTAMAVMTRYHTIHARDFVALVETLASIPDGDGTLLDSTVVVWTGELSTGEHAMTQWPVVIAGGSNYFKLGRYVRWAPKHVVKATWSDEPSGPPHNHLLVSLARSMGLELDQVGEASVMTASGALSCTGPLDRLT